MSYRIDIQDGTKAEIQDERYAGETKVMIDTQGNEWMVSKQAPFVIVPFAVGTPTLIEETPPEEEADEKRSKAYRASLHRFSDQRDDQQEEEGN